MNQFKRSAKIGPGFAMYLRLYLWKVIHLFFNVYTLLLLVRVVSSWIPDLMRYPAMRILAAITDPYLHLFRKVIPPIGGIVDITPMIAFISLQILERIILHIVMA